MAATFLTGAARAAAAVRPGARGDELPLLFIPAAHSARRGGSSGIYRPAGVALFGSRRPLDFVWVALAILGLWYLLPLGQNVAQVDLTGALFALGAGACWAVYILTGQRAGEEHGPATVAMGSLIASLVFVPLGMAQATDTLWQWSLLPLGLGIAILSTALPYSLRDDGPDAPADAHLRHADEP